MIQVTTIDGTNILFSENDIFRIYKEPNAANSILVRSNNTTIQIVQDPSTLLNEFTLLGTTEQNTTILFPLHLVKSIVEENSKYKLFVSNAGSPVILDSYSIIAPQSSNRLLDLSGAYHSLQGDLSPVLGQGSIGTTLTAQLIKPMGSIQVSEISINILSGVAGNAVVGIYDIGDDGYPNAKLAQTTEFNTSITGLQSIQVNNINLNGGTNYAVVFQSSATIPNMRRFGYAGSNAAIIWGTDGDATKYGLLTTANSYSAILPAAFPKGATLNTQPQIAVFFK